MSASPRHGGGVDIPRLTGMTRRAQLQSESVRPRVETVVEVRPARVAGSPSAAGLDSFADFYNASAGRAYGLALGLLGGDRVAAENVIIAGFIAVWSSAPCAIAEQSDELERMLFRQIRRRCLDRSRSPQDKASRAQPKNPSTMPVTYPTGEVVPPTSLTVRAELDALSREQRISIELAFFQGRTASQIAEEMGIPESSVLRAMRSGLRALTDHL